jgi:hypothetical protein
MKLTYAGIEIEASAKFVKEVYGFPFDSEEKNKDYHNEFQIKISRNGIAKTFLYYDSSKAWHDGKDELTTSDLKNAVECIFNDTLSSYGDFEDFCSGFGYSTDSKSVEKTYKAMVKNGKKVKDMGFTEDELIAFVNELNEHN